MMLTNNLQNTTENYSYFQKQNIQQQKGIKGVWKARSVGVSNLEEYEGGLIKVSVGE